MNQNIKKLTRLIDERTKQIFRTNSLFLTLEKRAPTPVELQQYIKNCHYLITYTQPNLRSALNTSITQYNQILSQYFLDKIFEEIGHEKWAEDDFTNNNLEKNKSELSPTASMKKLTEYLTWISKNDPIQYATYVLVAEYSMANFGQKVLELFKAEKNDKNQMTVISKHVELDTEHSDEDELKLAQIIESATPADFNKMTETIHHSLNLLDQSIAEIYEPEHTINETLTQSTSL